MSVEELPEAELPEAELPEAEGLEIIEKEDASAVVNVPKPQRKKPRLEKYFVAAIKSEASDIHLKNGAVPHLRLSSHLRPTTGQPLYTEDIRALAYEILNEKQINQLEETGSLDVSYQIEGSDRFRINIYRQRGELSLAARRVTAKIPNFEELNLPASLSKVCEVHQGLVMIAGITGSGKSTTIASMLEYINRRRACHIVTIEDPIEYIYYDKKALINQREVGLDVTDFHDALKYAMREDPDVILVGEMRDRTTFQAALQAAETGHLVFCTVHASTSGQTVSRILDLIDIESRDMVRQNLAHNLNAIICQKLLPCLDKDIGVVPAVEIMLANPVVRNFLEEGRENDLNAVIRGSAHEGMQDFNMALMDLIERDMVDPRVAYAVSPNPDELKMRMKGIDTKRGGLLGR